MIPTAWTSDDAEALGASIRACREAQQLTQEQVAYAAGMTRNHYALIEAGRSSSRTRGEPANPRIATLAAIAAVLDLRISDLEPIARRPHAGAVRAARRIAGS